MLLLSIAIMPLAAGRFWHHHYPKIVALLAAGTALGLWVHLPQQLPHELAHAILKEYVPFLCTAGSLYIISCGIRIRLPGSGRPYSNALTIAIGTILASFIGTMGASMLLIRPILAANNWRRYRAHTIVCFIFLVSNIGGSLSPLGDPPLFMGFLHGVDFFWPLKNLWAPFAIASVPLLTGYYLLDQRLYRQEKDARPEDSPQWYIHGHHHMGLLAAVVLTILLSTFLPKMTVMTIAGVDLLLSQVVRDLVLVTLSAVSYSTTSAYYREQNHFSWEPLQEVAILFAGLFVTLIPVQMLLHAGPNGPFAPMFTLLNGPHPAPLYFWFTGTLSAFLDNAPTYLLFFKMAGGNAAELMTTKIEILQAISLASVFMGAMTYIGNAPNLAIKSIAESEKIQMPSFFGYLGWACLILLPLYTVAWLLH
jgi:Na+/H+ antiporter NhaD/arsenite permease-like protein